MIGWFDENWGLLYFTTFWTKHNLSHGAAATGYNKHYILSIWYKSLRLKIIPETNPLSIWDYIFFNGTNKPRPIHQIFSKILLYTPSYFILFLYIHVQLSTFFARLFLNYLINYCWIVWTIQELTTPAINSAQWRYPWSCFCVWSLQHRLPLLIVSFLIC